MLWEKGKSNKVDKVSNKSQWMPHSAIVRSGLRVVLCPQWDLVLQGCLPTTKISELMFYFIAWYTPQQKSVGVWLASSSRWLILWNHCTTNSNAIWKYLDLVYRRWFINAVISTSYLYMLRARNYSFRPHTHGWCQWCAFPTTGGFLYISRHKCQHECSWFIIVISFVEDQSVGWKVTLAVWTRSLVRLRNRAGSTKEEGCQHYLGTSRSHICVQRHKYLT